MEPRLARRLPHADAIEAAARWRMPDFVHDYVTGGVGAERCKAANRAALDAVTLHPRLAAASEFVDAGIELFDRRWRTPFGVAPVGAGDALWPGAAAALSRAAARHGALFVTGTFTCIPVEAVRAIDPAQDWFQLYPPRDEALLRRVLDHLREAGVRVLVVTVDVPELPHRWREAKHGSAYPPRFSWRRAWQLALHPAWTAALVRHGMPRFPNIERHLPQGSSRGDHAAIQDAFGGRLDRAGMARIRRLWRDPLVVKGVLSVDDLRAWRNVGVDGAVISNHGGRQLDAHPATASVLQRLREAAGSGFPLLADGSCRSGTDVARYLALGADAVLAGRAPYLAVAAAGAAGAMHVLEIITTEFRDALVQLGCATPSELPSRLMV